MKWLTFQSVSGRIWAVHKVGAPEQRYIQVYCYQRNFLGAGCTVAAPVLKGIELMTLATCRQPIASMRQGWVGNTCSSVNVRFGLSMKQDFVLSGKKEKNVFFHDSLPPPPPHYHTDSVEVDLLLGRCSDLCPTNQFLVKTKCKTLSRCFLICADFLCVPAN